LIIRPGGTTQFEMRHTHLILKEKLQITEYYYRTSKSSKSWPNLSFDTLFFLNFSKLDMSFETCNQESYSYKYVKKSKVNLGFHGEGNPKILEGL